jgi:hypothetical protein
MIAPNPTTPATPAQPAVSNEYQLLIPIPTATNNLTTVPTNNPVQYVNTLFTILISLGVVLAVFMLVYAGVLYMSTDAITGKKQGKTIMMRTLYGFIVLVGCFLLLQTLNPRIQEVGRLFNQKGITQYVLYHKSDNQQLGIYSKPELCEGARAGYGTTANEYACKVYDSSATPDAYLLVYTLPATTEVKKIFYPTKAECERWKPTVTNGKCIKVE